jgi:hypothetical protein
MEFLAFDWSLGSVQCEINQWLLKLPLYLDNCALPAENTRIFVKGEIYVGGSLVTYLLTTYVFFFKCFLFFFFELFYLS